MGLSHGSTSPDSWILNGVSPVEWILPSLLLASWIIMWVAKRRVPWWYFVVGFALAILCFPVGIVAGNIELADVENCSPENLCFSINGVHWWTNGILGLLTMVTLSVATLIVVVVAAEVRRARSRRVHVDQRREEALDRL